VAVNDLGDKGNMTYLLKYDSVYGNSVCTLDGIKYLSEKEPTKLPWGELGVDIVVESTGFFASAEGAAQHISAGAKRVVITAPIKDSSDSPFVKGSTTSSQEGFKSSGLADSATSFKKGGITILMGLNEEKLKDCVISSNASCTTNAASPIIAILDEAVGIEKAVLNTVHAYTATQALVDGPAGKKGFREGRAAAQNIIPSSTGAAVAVTKAYPSLEGKFDGISLRVPVICGSIADITFIAKRDTSVDEVNAALTKAAKDKRWQGIFAVAEDELVSSDILGRPEGAIAELSMTRVVGGNLVKVLAWYDNESGYANTLVRHVVTAGQQL
jgi:glyceraldehyde 3-phosphate dehydrogenase